ncbi:hypothetical protein CDL12_18775 [Handroanthus impetiginosus]|uniref:Uncharacterized protein n=1 Tax=Handroanthus impetiginosus TaxID=429701 RepID=A0A2G9GTN4_9LAMI|nr:hypothetical protein CDL12_18775 [Handroanthus impetiginosus]
MDDYANPPSPSSFKDKLKQSLCFSCCFRRRHRLHEHLALQSPPLPSGDSQDYSLSEIKEKCRSMLGISGRHKRHSPAAEFRYDPLSYALNFEDGFDFDDEAPLRNFSARLPPSPPVPTAVV